MSGVATELDVFTHSFEASADLSSSQYLACYLDANARVVISDANDDAIGILQNKPAALSRDSAVRLLGISKMVVDGNAAAIAVNDHLKIDALGKGIKTTTDDNVVIAKALAASTAAGDIIPVLMLGPHNFRTIT